jgi:uncharacterized protein YfaS (alpha-2-macroglobulin family)
VIYFTAPFRSEDARKSIHVDGSVTALTGPHGTVTHVLGLTASLPPRTTRHITIDSSLADIGGRPLTGARQFVIDVGDRAPRVTHAAGFLTLSRDGSPVIRVSHVNVDSVELELLPLTAPASLEAALGNPVGISWSSRAVLRRTVALPGARNEIRTTDVPVLELTDPARPQVIAVRLRQRRGASGLRRSVIRWANESTSTSFRDTMTTAPAFLQRTNIAAHARVDESSGAVFVTDLRSGRPLREATVALREASGAILAQAHTNSSGVAVFPDRGVDPDSAISGRYGLRPSRFIEVRHEGDSAILPIALDYRNLLDTQDSMEWPLLGWRDGQRARRTLVFTDRDLYRPGERVFLAATVRDGRLDWLRVPERGERLRWVVRVMEGSDRPRVVHESVSTFTSFGTTADSFTIAPRSPLGYYSAELQREIGGQWQHSAQTSFRVLEYRAPEFVVDVAGDSVPRLAGDAFSVRVTGRYLYDAPMRGATVRWSAFYNLASPWDLAIPGLPRGFGFGDHPSEWEGRPESATAHNENGVDTLDSAGVRTIHLSGKPPLEGTVRVSFSAAVEDVNRQVVTSQHEQLLHGSAYYLTLRDAGSGWWWRRNEPVRLQVLAVRPDGSRSPGQSITARLVQVRWVDSSGTSAQGRWVPDTVATWPVTSADTAVWVSFTPREGGYYTLQLQARDDRGRAVESRIRRFVLGGYAPNNAPATRLSVQADTVQHHVGAPAMIRFDSPFEVAEAWITVEREGLLRQVRRQARRGPNEISLPVGADMSPAALVGVVLVNRAPAQPSDSLHDRFRSGMTRLLVDSMAKRLRVTVAPESREVAPGAEVPMSLRVTDSEGRGVSAAVTLWAVDEGVLSMGWYNRPDPVNAFQALRWRWLTLASTLESAVPFPFNRRPPINLLKADRARYLGMSTERLALSEVVVTGAAASSTIAIRGVSRINADLRDDFRTTAFFRATVLTDASGRATTPVKLPDNITTYRLFAVAVGRDDRAGSAESTFVATRPLVVRAAMPRFVRPGDEFVAGAAIGVRDGRPRDVRVEAGGQGIALTGASTTSVRITSGSGEATFSWRAREADSARVQIAAADDATSDGVRLALPVQPDRFPVAEAVSGVVRDTLTVRVTLPRDIDLRRSRLTIRAGTTPLPLLDEARWYLAQYPYACTEQLVASGRVIVASIALQRAGLPVRTNSRLMAAELQSVVDRLAGRQRIDGGFGYWSRDSWSTPWLSTTVGLLLADAATVGARVDTGVTQRLSGYLTRHLDSVPALPDTTFGTRLERRQLAANHLANRLAAATYLRRSGQPRQAEETALLQREPLLTWEDRVLLASLLHTGGRADDARNILRRAWQASGIAGIRVEFPDSISGRGLFRSRVRPVARLVEATLAIDPSNPRLGALMERLVSRTRAAGYNPWNTQDYAAGASAVAAFARTMPRGEAALVADVVSAPGGAQRIVLRTVDGNAADSTIGIAGLVGLVGDSLAVTIHLAAPDAPVFYSITSEQVSATPDTRPATRGVIVERWYERFDNGAAVTEVRAGDLVRVRLRVTVPTDREFVALDDPLPAGLEAVDLSLRTSGTLGPFATEASERARAQRDREAAAGGALGSWDSGWWSPWEHSEKRDDRVTWFARSLWAGSYTATYVARATTAGRFIRPPARAEEMYNAAVSGRSEGGTFVVVGRPR